MEGSLRGKKESDPQANIAEPDVWQPLWRRRASLGTQCFSRARLLWWHCWALLSSADFWLCTQALPFLIGFCLQGSLGDTGCLGGCAFSVLHQVAQPRRASGGSDPEWVFFPNLLEQIGCGFAQRYSKGPWRMVRRRKKNEWLAREELEH